ncbi:MAG TPA: dipeptidase [Candidatus Limnocylindrales bacterium]|nr:dipeptidase [Candidatus Limnocylindrales bacterium]
MAEAPARPDPSSGDPAVDRYLDESRDRRLESWKELLRIPSVSALPEHAGDCRRAAEHVGAELRRIGMEHVEISETGGHPIVYADWLHAEGAPTVIAYAHYDVQPVDPVNEWRNPPFEPTVDDGRILARGASDDKSSVGILSQAAEALLAARGSLPVNLRLVFEGEEETTSEHLEPWLAANRERLAGDVALICDSGFFAGNLPAVTIGLRGIMYAQIDVRGPFQDVHSGVYGGAVENPANALARIIAALKGPDGRILIPGFYDDVVPLSDADRAAYAALPFDEDEFRETLGVPALVGEDGYSVLERRSGRPTLDVNGIWGGFQGEGSKTIIPGAAHAKVSSRLVANQDPARIFAALRDFVLRIAPPGVEVEVRDLGSGRPTLTPIDDPWTQAFARAIGETFGREPLFVREGGSIPFVATFETLLGVPVVILGFTPPDGNFHAPNEWMDLANFEGGVRSMVRYWDELAGGV